jgi:hypothetical protein
VVGKLFAVQQRWVQPNRRNSFARLCRSNFFFCQVRVDPCDASPRFQYSYYSCSHKIKWVVLETSLVVHPRRLAQREKKRILHGCHFPKQRRRGLRHPKTLHASVIQISRTTLLTVTVPRAGNVSKAGSTRVHAFRTQYSTRKHAESL